jgi:hypothetical protein
MPASPAFVDGIGDRSKRNCPFLHVLVVGAVVPVSPTNQLAMLTDYIVPEERVVACPNQDVVYGFSILSLDREPVVIQVPDFGSRF